MLLLISYDLKSPGRDYESLYSAIKQCSTKWWHYLESVWIIKTDMPVKKCNATIQPHLDENDFLMIYDISNKEHDGWLPSKAWDWIVENDK